MRAACRAKGTGLLIRLPTETMVAAGASPSTRFRPQGPSTRLPKSHSVPAPEYETSLQFMLASRLPAGPVAHAPPFPLSRTFTGSEVAGTHSSLDAAPLPVSAPLTPSLRTFAIT
jgi:hypothetical protein